MLSVNSADLSQQTPRVAFAREVEVDVAERVRPVAAVSSTPAAWAACPPRSSSTPTASSAPASSGGTTETELDQLVAAL